MEWFIREFSIYIALYISCNRFKYFLVLDGVIIISKISLMMDCFSEPQANVVFRNNFQVSLDRIFQLKRISLYVEVETVLPQQLNLLKFPTLRMFLEFKYLVFLFFRKVTIPLFDRSEPIFKILQKNVPEPWKSWIVIGGKWHQWWFT